jgi:hypothetical protein
MRLAFRLEQIAGIGRLLNPFFFAPTICGETPGQG